MKTLYFDCAGGISGNIILGALLDLDIPTPKFKNELLKTQISGWNLKKQRIIRNGIHTTKIDFIIKNKKRRRSLTEIINIIQKSALQKQIKKRAQDIFRSIAAAESKIHNQKINKIHLHELGGEDTILDVVGTLILLDLLKTERIYTSKIPLGRGSIHTKHGLLPLPAPATAELLRDIPVYGVKTTKELTTPTGAAIIRNITYRFGPIPKMKITKIGYGSGSYQIKNLPNLLRVFLGKDFNE